MIYISNMMIFQSYELQAISPFLCWLSSSRCILKWTPSNSVAVPAEKPVHPKNLLQCAQWLR